MPRKKNSENFEQERERIHREMLSAVSHDLKTPLASIIGSLEVYDKLKAKLNEEKKHTLLKTALDEAYRLDNFITNILDMARLENKMVRIKKEHIHLKSVLSDCITKLGYKTAGVKIEIEGDDFVVDSDSNMLCRALYLVVENAVRHNTNEKPSVKIIFSGNTKSYSIRIEDNGPGIPEAKIKEIFSKYTRISRKDHQNAGTGLGLAICRQIATMLGGTVTASNIKDGGASFEFKFQH